MLNILKKYYMCILYKHINMQINDLNSPLPKPWLNISSNSINTNTIASNSLVTNSIDAGQIVSSSLVRNNFSGGTLQPADLISGVIGMNITGSGGVTVTIITLPSGASLDAALSQFTPPFYFKTLLTATYNTVTQGNINFNLGSGITSYNGTSPFVLIAYVNTAPVNIQNQIQRTLVFARSVSGWTFYT